MTALSRRPAPPRAPSRLALAALLGLALCAPAAAQEAARDGRLDGQVLDAYAARLESLAEAGVRAGFTTLIALDGEPRFATSAGYADIETGRPMTPDTPARIASMTKPVTAVAVMTLVEDGRLALDDPLSDYVPEFADARVATATAFGPDGTIPTEALARPITIHDLLTHTAGLGYLFDAETDLGRLHQEASLYAGEGTLEEKIAGLAALPLYSQPGERWRYSYANDVLGRVVEVASGMSFDAYVRQAITDPLGMDDTRFFPDAALAERAARLHTHDADGTLVALQDDGAQTLNPDWPSGGAGLFSTAEDYMRFLAMMEAGGSLGGATVLDPETVALMTSDRLTPAQREAAGLPFGYGYGWGVALEDGPRGLAGDYFWAGYFDTDALVSPSTGLTAVIIAQEQPGPGTPGEGARAIFRSFVAAAVAPEPAQ